MATYRISRRETGVEMGTFKGGSEWEALLALMKDASWVGLPDGGESGWHRHWLVEEEPAITTEQIEALRDEAQAAGDFAMVFVCDDALGGSGAARDVCAEAISDARAQG